MIQLYAVKYTLIKPAIPKIPIARTQTRIFTLHSSEIQASFIIPWSVGYRISTLAPGYVGLLASRAANQVN